MGEEVKKKSTQPSETTPDGWAYRAVVQKITCEKWPKSQKKLTIRCCEQHLMVGGIICSTIGKITCEKCSKSRMGEEVKKKKPQPSGAVNSTWWLGI